MKNPSEYRTRSGNDGMLPLKLSPGSGRYRSRFCKEFQVQGSKTSFQV